MSCALYRHFDANDKLLYIGISLSVLNRLAQHRGSDWSKEIVRVQIEYFPTKKEAGRAEMLAIKKEHPLYNKSGSQPKRQPKITMATLAGPARPKLDRATEAIRKDPAKSNRLIAKEIGVDKDTVRRARSQNDPLNLNPPDPD